MIKIFYSLLTTLFLFVLVSCIKTPIVEEDKFTVTFDSGGGTIVESMVVRENSKVAKPDDPLKEGYDFIEWQLNNKKYDFDTLVTKDITLVAKWELKKVENQEHTLTIYIDDLIYKTLKYYKDDLIDDIIIEEKEHYTFTWIDQIPDKMPDNDLAIKGKYVINTYTVKYIDDNNDLLKSIKVDSGTKLVDDYQPLKEGYTFEYWMLDDVEYDFDILVTKDITLIAKWQLKEVENQEYTLTIYIDDLVYKTIKYFKDDLIEDIIIEEKEHYTFTWIDQIPDQMPDNDLFIKGKYVINTYTVIYIDDNNDLLKSIKVDSGTKLVDNYKPLKEGYTFEYWLLDDVEYDFNKVVKSDLTLKASYKINEYKVTYLEYDGTTLKELFVEHGNKVVNDLEPSESLGKMFLYWTLDNLEYDFNIPLMKSIILVPKYQELKVKVTFDYNDSIKAKVEYYSIGQNISKPEEIRGFKVLGWYLNGELFNFNNLIKDLDDIVLKADLKELFEQEVLVFDFGSKANTGYTSSEITFTNNYDSNSYTFLKKQMQINNSGEHPNNGQVAILSPNNNFDHEAYFEMDLSNIDNLSKLEFEVSPWSDADYDRYKNKGLELYVEYYEGSSWIKLEDVNGDVNLSSDIKKGEINFITVEIDSPGLYRIYFKITNATATDNHRLIIDNVKLSAFFDMPDGNLVTFDYNYPNSPSNKLEVVEAGGYLEEFEPIRLGYEFLGWYLGDNEFNFNTPITSNITLRARWKQSKVVITIDLGYLDKVLEDILLDINEQLISLDEPIREGYIFKGWYKTDISTDNHESLTFPYKTIENVRLIASWELVNKNPDDLIRDDNNLDELYSSVKGLSGELLFNELSNIVSNSHTKFSNYSNARFALEEADRHPNYPNMVLGIYDRSVLYGPWNHPVWEREHVWPNSKLGVARAGNTTINQASDLHNLRAIIPTVNQRRSNRFFSNTTLNSPLGHQIGSKAYYPGNEDIGDVARILMYMVLRYDVLTLTNDEVLLNLGDTTNNNNTPETAYMGKLEVLYKWHLLDPVDDFEIQRNNVIEDYQGNRNPFIDEPELFKEVWDYLSLEDSLRIENVNKIITNVINEYDMYIDYYIFIDDKNKLLIEVR